MIGKKYYIQCPNCYEAFTIKKGNFKAFRGVSMDEDDRLAVCPNCGTLEWQVGYDYKLRTLFHRLLFRLRRI